MAEQQAHFTEGCPRGDATNLDIFTRGTRQPDRGLAFDDDVERLGVRGFFDHDLFGAKADDLGDFQNLLEVFILQSLEQWARLQRRQNIVELNVIRGHRFHRDTPIERRGCRKAA